MLNSSLCELKAQRSTKNFSFATMEGINAVGDTAGEKNEVLQPELITNFKKAHLQVGLVISVDDHPIAEKLYVCKVELGNDVTRQVVAGLKKFMSPSELLNRKVCVILNLKPAKLAGQVSEAMILAGAQQTEEGEIVKILEPPSQASVGDRIFLEGHSASLNPVKQLSSKIWEKMLPLLKVKDGFASYGPKKLVTTAGAVTVTDLPNGAGIH